MTPLARQPDPVSSYERLIHTGPSFAAARAEPGSRAPAGSRSDERNRLYAAKSSSEPTPEEHIIVAPDIAFQHCANAAAAIIEKAPPYLTYRVTTHVSAPSLGKERDVIRAVAVRTKDDLAVIQDLPKGANALGHGFPVTPTFDALSSFTLTWRVGAHTEVSSYVHDVKPLHYEDVANSGADVVVVRLRQYRAEYADDSSDAPDGKTHIRLEPYDFVKKQVARPDSTFFLSDLVIDNATGLPEHVRYDGGDDIQFVVDYGMLEGHWVVQHAHYEETIHGPLHIGRLHVIADAKYDEFVFSDVPPDPRLRGEG